MNFRLKNIILAISLIALPLYVAAQTTGIVLPPKINNTNESLQANLARLENTQKMLQQQLQIQIQNLVNVQLQITVIKKQLVKLQQAHADFSWQSPNNTQLPVNAFLANGQPKTYICQAFYAGYLYPGPLTQDGCLITYAGTSHTLKHYKVLVSKKSGYWIDGNKVPAEPVYDDGSSTPTYAPTPLSATKIANTSTTKSSAILPVVGGYEDGHVLYICRVYMNGNYYLGKAVTGDCDFALDGKEASIPRYQVLLSAAPKSKNGS